MKSRYVAVLMISTSLLFMGCTSNTETGSEVSIFEPVVIEEEAEPELVEESEPVEESEFVEESEPVEETEPVEEEESTEATGIEIVEELDLTMYAQTNCNGRDGDGTNYNKIASIQIGTNLHVTGKTSNDWYRVDLGEGEAYVSGSLLGLEAPAQQQQQAQQVQQANGESGYSGDDWDSLSWEEQAAIISEEWGWEIIDASDFGTTPPDPRWEHIRWE